jgi:hypothetical protein
MSEENSNLVEARLTKGEYVISAAALRKMGVSGFLKNPRAEEEDSDG